MLDVLKIYMKLFVATGTIIGVDKFPIQVELEQTHEGSKDFDKKMSKLSELNELAYNYLILFINTDSSFGKFSFGFVQNAKCSEFHSNIIRLLWTDW